MAYNYPNKPWKDGQEIKVTIGGKEVVIAKYDASKNLWTHLRVNNAGEFAYVSACDVVVTPDACLPQCEINADTDPDNLDNLQQWLDYFYFWIFAEDKGLLDRIIALEALTELHTDQIEELYRLLLTIDGLDDFSSLIERIIALENQVPPYADEVLQGSRPEKKGDPAIRQGPIFDAIDEYRERMPDYIVPNTQQETNHILYDLGVRPPVLSTDPPPFHPAHPLDPLQEGDLWIDDNSIMHYWSGTEWVEVLDSDVYTDRPYVKKAGDTMTGALVMDDAVKIEMQNTDLDFRPVGESLKDNNGDPVLNAGGDEHWDSSIDRFGPIESLPPRILRSDGTFGSDTSAPFGISVDIDDGNTFKNRFKVGNRNGDIVTFSGGENPAVTFGNFAQPESVHGFDNGVVIKNIPTPDFDVTPGNYAVNKEYVDARDELLRQDIIELEEEIDAIAPSIEYGTWEWEQPTSNLSAPEKGKFYLLDGSNQLTTEYKDTKIIVINNYEYDDPSDSDPVDIHTWADANPDELIQLFDAADPDFMLGKIVAVTPDTEIGSSDTLEFVRIEIDLIQSSGVPNDNPDPVTGKYLTRINVFKEPSGGNASDFVLKKGDEMTGELNIRTEQADGNANYTVPSIKDKHLRLSTTRTDTDSTRHAYLFQPGYSEDLMTSRHFMSGSNIYAKGTYLGYSSTGGTNFSTFPPRMNFQNSGGGFYWNGTATSNRRVYLNSAGGYLYYNGKVSAKWDENGFYGYYQDSLRFNTTSSGTAFEHPIFVHGNNCRIKAQNSAGTSSGGTYGNAGQVLTSQGNAPPRWKDPAGGGKVDITCSSSGKTKGDLWYCSNDQVLYLKIS